jgi:hypothetical protein
MVVNEGNKMNSPICTVLDATPFRTGDEVCVDIRLHAHVQFRFQFTPEQAAKLGGEFTILAGLAKGNPQQVPQ